MQAKLFKYLATVFIEDANIYNTIRRVTSVITTLHTIKYFYWIVNPADRSGIAPKGVGNSLIKISKISYLAELPNSVSVFYCIFRRTSTVEGADQTLALLHDPLHQEDCVERSRCDG